MFIIYDRAEVDLQVTLAREHAARLGVVNQGVESLLNRAHKVYGINLQHSHTSLYLPHIFAQNLYLK